MIKRYDVWRVLLAGTQPVDSYDVGEAVTQPATHPYLLFRTLDRERAEIRETVVTFQRGGLLGPASGR